MLRTRASYTCSLLALVGLLLIQTLFTLFVFPASYDWYIYNMTKLNYYYSFYSLCLSYFWMLIRNSCFQTLLLSCLKTIFSTQTHNHYRKMDKLLLFFNGEPKQNMQIGLKICKYFRMHVSVGGSVTVYTKKYFFASKLSWGCSHFLVCSLLMKSRKRSAHQWQIWYFCCTFWPVLLGIKWQHSHSHFHDFQT